MKDKGNTASLEEQTIQLQFKYPHFCECGKFWPLLLGLARYVNYNKLCSCGNCGGLLTTRYPLLHSPCPAASSWLLAPNSPWQYPHIPEPPNANALERVISRQQAS